MAEQIFGLEGVRDINPVLTQYMQTYEPADTIAEKLFPIINLNRTKGEIPKTVLENYTRRAKTFRANMAPTNVVKFLWDKAEFKMKKYSLGSDYSQDDLQEAKAIGGVFADLPLFRTKQLYALMDLDREYRAYDEIVANATAGSLTGNQWNDSSGVTIAKDIRNEREKLRKAFGKMPNILAMSRTVADVVFQDPTFIGYLQKMTQVALLADEDRLALFAKWAGIPNIVVADMISQETVEGQTSADNVDVWKDTVAMAYVEPLAKYSGFGHGFTFRKNIYVREYEMKDLEGFRVELNNWEIPKIINPKSIRKIENVLA